MRSKLFVPGSRPELWSKALATSGADAISIDLEDAVHESRKADGRAALSEFLRDFTSSPRATTMMVRINAVTTRHFAADLAAIAWPSLDVVSIPKVEGPDDVRIVASILDNLEGERRIPKPIGILPTIETPRAMRCAAEIAAAHPRVVGLQLGFADLLEPLGIDRSYAPAIQQLQLSLRLAAGEAGVDAIDAVFADVRDPHGYRREAEIARRLGYRGKSCIHPSQVPIANEVFQPSGQEIERAVRIVEAWREAQSRGTGVLLVDGRMIDLPFARGAEALLDMARRLGLLGPE